MDSGSPVALLPCPDGSTGGSVEEQSALAASEPRTATLASPISPGRLTDHFESEDLPMASPSAAIVTNTGDAPGARRPGGLKRTATKRRHGEDTWEGYGKANGGDNWPAVPGRWRRNSQGGGFVFKLYEMLTCDSLQHYIHFTPTFTPTGDSFVIPNSDSFAAHVLPLYFTHANFSSFVRQLNSYGFSRLKPKRALGEPWQFWSPLFRRDNPALHEIKRKIAQLPPLTREPDRPDVRRSGSGTPGEEPDGSGVRPLDSPRDPDQPPSTNLPLPPTSTPALSPRASAASTTSSSARTSSRRRRAGQHTSDHVGLLPAERDWSKARLQRLLYDCGILSTQVREAQGRLESAVELCWQLKTLVEDLGGADKMRGFPGFIFDQRYANASIPLNVIESDFYGAPSTTQAPSAFEAYERTPRTRSEDTFAARAESAAYFDSDLAPNQVATGTAPRSIGACLAPEDNRTGSSALPHPLFLPAAEGPFPHDAPPFDHLPPLNHLPPFGHYPHPPRNGSYDSAFSAATELDECYPLESADAASLDYPQRFVGSSQGVSSINAESSHAYDEHVAWQHRMQRVEGGGAYVDSRSGSFASDATGVSLASQRSVALGAAEVHGGPATDAHLAHSSLSWVFDV